MLVVIMALGATALFGVSNVLMHVKARAAPAEHSLRPTLLVHLARQPVWLAGIGTQMAGFGLQATALGLGSLTVVQALGPVGLLLALPLAARVSHKRFRGADWVGAVATVGGLAAFLAIAAPSKGVPVPTASAWSVLLAATVAGSGALIAMGRRLSGAARAIALGTASGAVLALTAAFTKTAADRFSHGFLTGVASWEPYALAVSGLLGILLMQSSFQAGDLEWSLPAMAVANPVVSVIAGTVAFHEHLSAPAGTVAILPVSLAVVLAGVVVLARSPALVAIYEEPAGELGAGLEGVPR